MKMKPLIASALAATLLIGTGASALAFDDLDGVAQRENIMELKERGVVTGVGNGKFAPHERMTAQTAIPLIVKGIGLNLDRFRFMKPPVASDYFTKIADDAWYAEAFVIAHMNGLPIDTDIDPAAPVSREQFAQWLVRAVFTTGDYPMIKMLIVVGDEDRISEGYAGDIQAALLLRIAELDKEGNFRPQETVTRAEAAVMVRNAIRLIEDRQRELENQPPASDPVTTGEVTASAEAVNEDIRKITLSWGEKPHAGWSIRIEGIDFVDSDSAVVRYSLYSPDPTALYAQVITEPKATTYVPMQYADVQYRLVARFGGEPTEPNVQKEPESVPLES